MEPRVLEANALAAHELFEDAVLPLVERPAEPRDGAVKVPAVPTRMVILEALLDARDIAQLHSAERARFDSVLSRVDREASITTWPRSEPAAVTQWRLGVLSRARQSDVARAILHALEPYHTLIRMAHPLVPVAVLSLEANAVATVRKRAVLAAWLVEIEQVVAGDHVEREPWLRYRITVSSPAGTHEHTIAWQRGVAQRAATGGAVAARVIESLDARDRAIAELDCAAAQVGRFVVHVPRAAR